ncbi:MAG: SRPBCC domain-containing protein [Sphingobacteriaceae bacterium]|nr:MAG: SRPBCC domain-containing protein [Sphingobacteriaceae bacterium]
METKDFTTTILVDNTPQEVFNAISQPQNWWTGEFTGSAEKLNDEFTYRYKDMHYSKQRVAEMIPGKKILWLVTDSQLNFIEDKSEWTGTKIIFEMDEQDGKTRLRFTHEGITPEVECFSACSPAWTNLIQESLFKYITTGEKQSIALD